MKKSYEEFKDECYNILINCLLKNPQKYKDLMYTGSSFMRRYSGCFDLYIDDDELFNFINNNYHVVCFKTRYGLRDGMFIMDPNKITTVRIDNSKDSFCITAETNSDARTALNLLFEDFIKVVKEFNPPEIDCDVKGKKKLFESLPDEDKLWFEIQYPEFTAKMMPIKREKIDKEKIKNSVSGLSEKELKKLKEMIKNGEI